MNRKFRSITTILIFILSPFTTSVTAHEFERGYVERSLDVVVRGKTVQVKYAVGLSDETIVDMLSKAEMIDSKVEERFRKSISDLEASEQAEAGEDGQERVASGFQAELADLFKEKLGKSLTNHLSLLEDGKPIQVEKAELAKSARHHVALEMTLLATISDDEAIELSVVDRNFLDTESVLGNSAQKQAQNAVTDNSAEEVKFLYTGNIRLACRAKGNAVLINSNVAPVLARSQRIETGGQPLDERVKSSTVLAKIAFATTEND